MPFAANIARYAGKLAVSSWQQYYLQESVAVYVRLNPVFVVLLSDSKFTYKYPVVEVTLVGKVCPLKVPKLCADFFGSSNTLMTS